MRNEEKPGSPLKARRVRSLARPRLRSGDAVGIEDTETAMHGWQDLRAAGLIAGWRP